MKLPQSKHPVFMQPRRMTLRSELKCKEGGPPTPHPTPTDQTDQCGKG